MQFTTVPALCPLFIVATWPRMFAVRAIAIASIVCMLLRPRNLREAYFVCAGAALLVVSRLIPLTVAWHAVRKGMDVYLFLAGMLLMAELARRQGVFEWLADVALRAARGSSIRLFLLIYAVGIVVTAFLSNDATAVVLTPAVFAAVKRAKAPPLPNLLACAFIANAASFLLPISNPANLILFGAHIPALREWLGIFFLPSVVAIGTTLPSLWALFHRELRGGLEGLPSGQPLDLSGKVAGSGLLLAAVTLVIASARGVSLGPPTCVAAIVLLLAVGFCDHHAPQEIIRGTSWSVLPLVAGLFVIVEALNRAGAYPVTLNLLQAAERLSPAAGRLSAAFGSGLVSNVMNNLPVGLASGAAIQSGSIRADIGHALLIGVDLGPNLSVTGSLATILWLIALRREGLDVSSGQFLRAGIFVMPITLALAVLVMGPGQ